MSDNPHAQHRKRLRDQFLRNGLRSFEPHQMLELALFYSIPRQDTNPLAHRLLDTFGSLANVFNASYEELCRVPGISHNTAVFLMMQRQLFQEYYKSIYQTGPSLSTTQKAAEFIVPHFVGLQEERLFLVCLDVNCRVVYADFLSEGSSMSVSAPTRAIFSAALSHHAAAVLLAHNHPHHYAFPSVQDVECTRSIVNTLLAADICLLDHFIVPGVPTSQDDLNLENPHLEYVSMRETPSLSSVFEPIEKHPSLHTFFNNFSTAK